MSEQYGRTRLVVGAHYGTKDFLVQRVTAVILALYSVIFLIAILFTPVDYEHWRGFFTFTCMGFPLAQVFSTFAFLSLSYHAWIGVRDIWMDYIKPVGLRLALQVLTILWLIASIFYFLQVLWSL